MGFPGESHFGGGGISLQARLQRRMLELIDDPRLRHGLSYGASRCRPLEETDDAAELSKARAGREAAEHAAMRAAGAAAEAKSAAFAERVEANKREEAAKLAAESTGAQAGLEQALREEEAAVLALRGAVAQQAQVPSKRKAGGSAPREVAALRKKLLQRQKQVAYERDVLAQKRA